MNKFYNFIKEDELYLYGAIVSDKWFDDEVTATDFRNKIDSLNDNTTLNIYINSPGGEIFITEGIIAMLDRAKKNKNVTINAYIDGIGASCASWLPMICNEIFIYKHSMLMLHKPMGRVWGNANDMLKEIEILDKLEESIMNSYLSKAKEGITEDVIKEMMTKETWLTSAEIAEVFNVTLLEDSSKKYVACADREYFNRYNNVPKDLLKTQDEEAKRLAELDIKNKEIEITLALI